MATNGAFVLVETPWARPPEDVIAEGSALGGRLSPDNLLLEAKEFFSGKSLAQLAREQGVGPVQDIGVFSGGIPDDEDVDELLAQLEAMRRL
jgi:hypothetical protein